ncbi:Rpp25l [Columba livia]|nr:Rpp25l [Columba livia]
MENYKKTKIVEKPCPLPFTDLPSDIIEMKVKDGSKIRNLMSYAISKMELDSVRQILFTGSGKAVSKTITCVEIMKRRLKELHQITKVLFKQIEEIWEPIVPEAGLDALTVKRNIPAICVLLSKDALDPQEPGYQAPGSFDTFWIETLKADSQGQSLWMPTVTMGMEQEWLGMRYGDNPACSSGQRQLGADLDIRSLACTDGDGDRAGVGDAPEDPNSTCTSDLSLPVSHSGPATQNHGISLFLSAGECSASFESKVRRSTAGDEPTALLHARHCASALASRTILKIDVFTAGKQAENKRKTERGHLCSEN